MSEASPPIPGFPLGEGLWRMLRSPREEAGCQAFLAAHGLEPDADPMSLALQGEDWQVQPGRVDSADLACLEGPALLELKDGGWFLLPERASGGSPNGLPNGSPSSPPPSPP